MRYNSNVLIDSPRFDFNFLKNIASTRERMPCRNLVKGERYAQRWPLFFGIHLEQSQSCYRKSSWCIPCCLLQSYLQTPVRECVTRLPYFNVLHHIRRPSRNSWEVCVVFRSSFLSFIHEFFDLSHYASYSCYYSCHYHFNFTLFNGLLHGLIQSPYTAISISIFEYCVET